MQHVSYVQRILDVGDGSAAPNHKSEACRDALHALLFHPIAGDSMSVHMQSDCKLPPMLAMKQLQFGLLDPDCMRDLSVAQITNPACAETAGCLNDLRMGANPNGKACHTCAEHHHNCPGHFGHIVLPHPVTNPLFVNLLVSILQIMCMNCHRLRISPLYARSRPRHCERGRPHPGTLPREGAPAHPDEVHRDDVLSADVLSVLQGSRVAFQAAGGVHHGATIQRTGQHPGRDGTGQCHFCHFGAHAGA